MRRTFTVMLKQVESTLESPEQLLRMLESELTTQRARRQRSSRNRVAVLAGGLLVVLAATAAALMMLFSMLNDLALRERPAAPVAGATTRL